MAFVFTWTDIHPRHTCEDEEKNHTSCYQTTRHSLRALATDQIGLLTPLVARRSFILNPSISVIRFVDAGVKRKAMDRARSRLDPLLLLSC
jgi:hypothetical protein